METVTILFNGGKKIYVSDYAGGENVVKELTIDADFDELRKCSCGCSLFVINKKKYTIDKGTVHCNCEKGNLENVCHVNCDHGSIEEYICSNCKNEISIYQVV